MLRADVERDGLSLFTKQSGGVTALISTLNDDQDP